MTGGGDLLQMFRDEANERLDRMVETLLALERGAARPDALDSLFRDAHSIKGSAGMIGLDEAYSIAHGLEDVLAAARAQGALAGALADQLLRATDALRRAVAGEEGVAETAVAELSGTHGQANAEARPAAARRAPASTPRAETVAERPRTPTERRSMRVDAEKVDRLLDAVGETVLHHRRLEHELRAGDAGPAASEAHDMLERGDALLEELQEAVIRLRMLPLASITGPFPRAVRDLAAELGKEAELRIVGAETQLDRVILEGASEAISHLLRNAVAHGIESPDERRRAGKPPRGRVELRAEQRGDRVTIEVTDDGAGVAPELLRSADAETPLADVLTAPGVSGAASVTHVSGRGVGLNAVRSHVEAVGGEVTLRTEAGRGTSVGLLLPISLALLHALIAERSGDVFGIPLAAVEEVVEVEEPMSLLGRPSIEVRGDAVPLADPVAVLGGSPAALPERPTAVVARSGGSRAALVYDRVVDEQEVLVKPLGPLLTAVAGYLGATVLGDGKLAPVLDPAQVVPAAARRGARLAPSPSAPAAPRILVVDDQFTVRELQRSILEVAGYRVATARDGREAWNLISKDADVQLVITDIEMPEMDGFELLRAIRRLPERSSLPVVVVTSRGRSGDEHRGLEAGADAYIVKERFDQQTLLDTVQRLIVR